MSIPLDIACLAECGMQADLIWWAFMNYILGHWVSHIYIEPTLLGPYDVPSNLRQHVSDHLQDTEIPYECCSLQLSPQALQGNSICFLSFQLDNNVQGTLLYIAMATVYIDLNAI